jgi:dethiobiotin synthetase
VSRGYFITGTDTGVGKTWVSCALLSALRNAGRRCAAMKPVASGCHATADGLRNDDALSLMEHAGLELPYGLVNPYALPAATAPHLAARAAGDHIDIASIARCYERLATGMDLTVVEGVGGWLVPLNSREFVSDLARALGMTVILVVGVRLGCLNHALLSSRAILAEEVPFGGWIANCITPPDDFTDDVIATLTERIPVPCCGVVPYLADGSPAAAGMHIDLGRLGV